MSATAPLTAADYEVVIGLEVHCQLKTNTKMFCGCKNEFGGPSNSHVCPVCLGMPGVLPVPNEEAIVKTLLTGEMLGCQIATRCKFDRKNYFYPDMPKNYQISQYDEPLCAGGAVTLDLLAYPKDAQKDPATVADKAVRLVRIHLEEDVAKSFHFEDGTSGIDFNRAGTPLMEIVSEADMSSPEEAFAYLAALKQILIYGGVSDADMEKGQMRCDVNISVRPRGQKEFGTKCELKNLNSISGVRRALKYEIARQIDVVTSGGTIEQQTRRWDDDKGETTLMRTKEKAHDYRYFPDPDIQPVRTDHGLYEEAVKRLPELPKAKKVRLVGQFGVSAYQAGVLASDATLADYFEQPYLEKPNLFSKQYASISANLLINDFLAMATSENPVPSVPPEFFAELADLVGTNKINSKQAKEVFAEMMATKKSPLNIVQERGLSQISDAGALEALYDLAIAANPKSVADFKAGKENALNALKGQVMKLSKGTANPQLVGELLVNKLQNPNLLNQTLNRLYVSAALHYIQTAPKRPGFEILVAEQFDNLGMSLPKLAARTYPLIFEDANMPETPYAMAGTTFLARFRNRLFAIMAKHCLGSGPAENVRIACNQKTKSFLPIQADHRAISNNVEDDDCADITILEANPSMLSVEEQNDLNILELDTLAEGWKQLKNGMPLIIPGYPNETTYVDYDDEKLVEQRYVMHGVYEGATSSKHICQVSFLDSDSDLVLNINGMSGSPVFLIKTESDIYYYTLAGMMIRGNAGTKGRFVHAEVIFHLLSGITQPSAD